MCYDAFGCLNATGDSEHIVYRASDGGIHELHSTPGGMWHSSPMPQGVPAADCTGNVYAWKALNSLQLPYATHGVPGLHELYRVPGGAWAHADLTSKIPGSVLNKIATPFLIGGYAWDAGNSKHILFYSDNGGTLGELSVSVSPQQNWHFVDVVQDARDNGYPQAPVPYKTADVTNGYAWDGKKSRQLAYLDKDGNVHELYRLAGDQHWRWASLTAAAKKMPKAKTIVNAYAWDAGQSKQVVFVDVNGEVGELSISLLQPLVPSPIAFTNPNVPTGPHWTYRNLTVDAKAPKPVSVVCGYACEAGKSKHVLCTGENGILFELSYHLPPPLVPLSEKAQYAWKYEKVIVGNAVPKELAHEVTAFNAFSWESRASRRIIYKDWKNGHIFELTRDVDATEWTRADRSMVAV